MKKIMIFSLLFVLCCMGAMAQEFSSEKLRRGVWRLTLCRADEKTVVTYNDSIERWTYTIFWKGKWDPFSADKPYYLSNSVPKKFDFNRVGKGDNGRYLVTWNDKMKEVRVYEIADLTDDYLKFKLDDGDILVFKNER